jgi:hypothetical protein
VVTASCIAALEWPRGGLFDRAIYLSNPTIEVGDHVHLHRNARLDILFSRRKAGEPGVTLSG